MVYCYIKFIDIYLHSESTTYVMTWPIENQNSENKDLARSNSLFEVRSDCFVVLCKLVILLKAFLASILVSIFVLGIGRICT